MKVAMSAARRAGATGKSVCAIKIAAKRNSTNNEYETHQMSVNSSQQHRTAEPGHGVLLRDMRLAAVRFHRFTTGRRRGAGLRFGLQGGLQENHAVRGCAPAIGREWRRGELCCTDPQTGFCAGASPPHRQSE